MKCLPDYVLELLKNIAKTEGFSNIEINLSACCSHDDGFIGALTSVAICGLRQKDGVELPDKLHLVCKLIPDNVTRRREYDIDILFEREVVMYNKVLPMLTQFQRDHGLTGEECFIKYPKCYVAIADAANDKYVIILDDLKVQGFKMWPKQQTPTPDHSRQTLEALAKLHAVSLVLKEQQPAVYEELKQYHDVFTPVMSKGFKCFLDLARARTIEALGSTNEEYCKIANKIFDNGAEYYGCATSPEVAERFGVLGHGDCWINNVMFRYNQESNDLVDVTILDWQIGRFESIALDLHDVLLTSSDKEFRQKHYKNLLEDYYKALSDTITKLGGDPVKLITFDELQDEMRRTSKYILIIGTLVHALVIPDAKDIPDLDNVNEDTFKETDSEKEYTPLDDATQQRFRQRLYDLIKDFVDYGFLDNL